MRWLCTFDIARTRLVIACFTLHRSVERGRAGFRGNALARGLRSEISLRIARQRIGWRVARRFAFGPIAPIRAIAATMAVTTAAASLRRFARHR